MTVSCKLQTRALSTVQSPTFCFAAVSRDTLLDPPKPQHTFPKHQDGFDALTTFCRDLSNTSHKTRPV